MYNHIGTEAAEAWGSARVASGPTQTGMVGLRDGKLQCCWACESSKGFVKNIQRVNEIGNKKAEALLCRLLERLLTICKLLMKDFSLRSSSLLDFSSIFGLSHRSFIM